MKRSPVGKFFWSLTNYLNYAGSNVAIFFAFVSITSCQKLSICYVTIWSLNFAVNHVTSFSRQKSLKSKNKKHTTVWSTKFNHPAKFGLKRIKTVKADSSLASLSDPKVATADLAWTNSFYNKVQIHRAFWLVQKVVSCYVEESDWPGS